jgi:hypothetical protein
MFLIAAWIDAVSLKGNVDGGSLTCGCMSICGFKMHQPANRLFALKLLFEPRIKSKKKIQDLEFFGY